MYNTSADVLELVASDLRQIARTYTNAAQQLDQQVITLDGAVGHVLSDGVMPWKGLSSDAFVSAWLERQARLKQASTLMSQSAGQMTTLAQTIEDNVPMVRAGQSIQLQPVFASMESNAQQAVLDEVSQAQNAIFMALAALNSQLEVLAEEVGNCPEADRKAGTPGLYDNISRSDVGGDTPPVDDGGLPDDAGGGDEGKNEDPNLGTGFVKGQVNWVEEKASMSSEARAYDDGAPGKEVDPVTGETLTPALNYKDADGNIRQVRFDGLDGDVLVDRKVSVTTYPKTKAQALRQSQALEQNGLKGRWEVPNEAEAARAIKMFEKLGITNIDVKVVPL